jgi:hypothetical protein
VIGVRRFVAFAAALLCSVGALAQKPIPVRTLSSTVATDSGVLRYLENVRPLSNGRVLVNDRIRQRLILFDGTLRRFTTVADTAEGARNPNGSSSPFIIPFLGDSTIFVDRDARAFVVINPNGAIGRTMAMPNVADMLYLSIGERGAQGFDPQMRLVYSAARVRPRTVPPANTDTTFSVGWTHDSNAVIRRGFDSPADTLALLVRPSSKSWTFRFGGSTSSRGAQNPIPTTDDWALLPDGTVAIVRSHDYHIDWIHPDGTVTATPKMAFDWLRIPPEEKERLADSINRKPASDPRTAGPPPARSLVPGMPAPTMPQFPQMSFDAEELPDYYPPIRLGQVKSDPEGNVWILPTTSVLADGGLIYDVVNRQGEVVERVKLPAGRRLLAVGAGGVVYMAYTPKGLVRLERAHVVR